MVGIVFMGDLKYCPYIHKYIQILEKEQKDYEVLFWNREGTLTTYPSNYIPFKKNSKLNKHWIFKLLDFVQFSNWVNNKINSKEYEKLIILSTLSGIIIAKTLIQKYKDKYIFDIRDYSYEKIKIFYSIEEKIIQNSFFTCISSLGFKAFLPTNYSYVIAHNFNRNDIQFIKSFKKKRKGSTLNLVWIGSVRYFEHQVKILNKLKNDKRFNIIFHGTGPQLEIFKKFCTDNQIANIHFTGEYDNNEKAKLLANADILNNSYGKKNEICIKYAIANKYYDGLIFRIPQLVEINTFKYEKVNNSEVGIGIDIYSKDFANKLYDFYFSINEESFNINCDKELHNIEKDDIEYLGKIREFIRK